MLRNNMNPFDFSGINHGLLYNIKTGYRVPEAVVDFHLNVKKRITITRWISFECTIKQNKILNFATCNKKQKVTINNKV